MKRNKIRQSLTSVSGRTSSGLGLEWRACLFVPGLVALLYHGGGEGSGYVGPFWAHHLQPPQEAGFEGLWVGGNGGGGEKTAQTKKVKQEKKTNQKLKFLRQNKRKNVPLQKEKRGKKKIFTLWWIGGIGGGWKKIRRKLDTNTS